MAEIINLRQARKQKKRDEKDRKAEENRVKFGRTKAQKFAETFNLEKQKKDLDGKKRDE